MTSTINPVEVFYRQLDRVHTNGVRAGARRKCFETTAGEGNTHRIFLGLSRTNASEPSFPSFVYSQLMRKYPMVVFPSSEKNA